MGIMGRIGSAAIGLALLAAGMAASASAQTPTTITMAVKWNASNAASGGFVPAAKLFEAGHPGVKVQFLWSTGGGKVGSMIAAGDPPDIVFGGDIAGILEGRYLPLDSYFNASGLKPTDFIPSSWEARHFNGHLYALQLEVDPNFALIWSKDLFGASGLNPDVGPKTLSDYETDFRKLTRFDANGNVTQVGDEPWTDYGYANTAFAWSYIFGGRYYNPATGKITAVDPNNVDAFSFLKEYWDTYEQHMPHGTFPFAAYGSDLLLHGNTHIGMKMGVTAQIKSFVEKYPKIKIGITMEPYKADTSTPNPTFQGGYSLAIPVGAKHPELAWEFLSFLCASKAGTEAVSKPANWIPAYLPSPIFKDYMQDPIMSAYVQIAEGMHHVKPLIPVRTDLTLALDHALGDVYAGKTTPLAALTNVQKAMQAELDEYRAKHP